MLLLSQFLVTNVEPDNYRIIKLITKKTDGYNNYIHKSKFSNFLMNHAFTTFISTKFLPF